MIVDKAETSNPKHSSRLVQERQGNSPAAGATLGPAGELL